MNPTTFTSTMAKRADVTGTPAQVYLQPNMVDFLLNAIRNKMVAAIGTVDNDTELKYIFNPQVHSDLAGTPIAIVGNASNIKGEVSLAKVNIEAIRYFAHVKARGGFYVDQILGANLPANMLANTDWTNMADYAASLMPNFFPLYFGQEPVYGELRDDEVMVRFCQLGTGYEHWGMAAVEAHRDLDHTLQVVDNVCTASAEQQFLDPNWNPTARKIARDNGPIGSIKTAQSADYPQERMSIGTFFDQAQQIAQQPFLQGNTLTITMPGEQEKEVQAVAGQAKLQLFLIGGTINTDSSTVSNLSYPVLSTSMNGVLATARAARTSSFTDLLNTAFYTAAGADPTSIYSTQVSIQVMQATAAASLLAGNFSKTRAQDYNNESSTLDMSAFLPQMSPKVVESIIAAERMARNESMMELTDLQKAKPKTVIARIGTMTDVDMFSSLCINFLTCISAIVDVEGMNNAGTPSIFRQILQGYVNMVNGKDWRHWATSVGVPMPNLPWTLYQFMEGSWVGLADFALNATNVNVFMGNQPITALDTSGLQQATRAYAACKSHFEKLFALAVPCTMVPRIIPASVRDAPLAITGQSVINAAGAGGSAKRGNGGGSTAQSTETTVAPVVKKRRGARSDSEPKSSRTEKGLFFVKPNLSPTEIFPRLEEKLCVHFACKGKECTRSDDQCAYKHVKTPSQLKPEVIRAIGDHFMRTGNGWFNKHQWKATDLPDAKYQCLLGDARTGMQCTAAECASPSSG